MNSVATGVAGFVILLGAAVVVAILAERIRVPVAVALVAAGAFVHAKLPFAFGDTLLFVFLPPLIFEAAWNLDLDALRRTAWRIVALALPGTMLTAGFVAGGTIGPASQDAQCTLCSPTTTASNRPGCSPWPAP